MRVAEYAARPLKDSERMELQENGGKLRIRWSRDKAFRSRMFLQKHLVVELPQDAALEELRVDTVSGGAYLSGFQAEECRVSTVSGAARCQGLRAQRLRVEAVSGAASLENVAAEELRCTTTSGKLELCGFAVQRLRAETVSGALTAGGNGEELSLSTVSGQLSLQVGQHPRQVKLNTVSGRIYAGLPEGEPGFTVEYSSMSGAFSSQFPLSGELGKRKGRAVYGSGGASLRLDTVSGAMELHVAPPQE
ncbi:MAG: DUF4097 family beta strand repeat-containing protein [Acutalibacter sp.]